MKRMTYCSICPEYLYVRIRRLGSLRQLNRQYRDINQRGDGEQSRRLDYDFHGRTRLVGGPRYVPNSEDTDNDEETGKDGRCKGERVGGADDGSLNHGGKRGFDGGGVNPYDGESEDWFLFVSKDYSLYARSQ
jgi:hypothetical protein